MTFSVLLSVYGKDDASFFKEALLSVSKEQTVKPAQIVVVEDGPVPEDIEHAIEDAVKVSPECENKVHTVGLILLMLLMVYITFNDIIKLF